MDSVKTLKNKYPQMNRENLIMSHDDIYFGILNNV